MMAVLLLRSTLLITQRHARDSTALHRAARRGYLDVAELLVVSGTDPNITSQWGSSLLAIAAKDGSIKVTKLLLSIMTDIDSQGGDGDTVLNNAAGNSHRFVVRALLDAGPKIAPCAREQT